MAAELKPHIAVLFEFPTLNGGEHSMLSILQQPDGGVAVWLSMIPFCSPIAMPVRWAASQVPMTELFGSIALLLATLLLVTWVAGRIYRVGILMYGTRPSPKELLRWVRAG